MSACSAVGRGCFSGAPSTLVLLFTTPPFEFVHTLDAVDLVTFECGEDAIAPSAFILAVEMDPGVIVITESVDFKGFELFFTLSAEDSGISFSEVASKSLDKASPLIVGGSIYAKIWPITELTGIESN